MELYSIGKVEDIMQGKLREVSRDAFGGILGLVCS